MQEKEQLMISTHMEQLPEDVQMKFLQAYERLSRQDKDVMLMELQAMYPEFRDQNQSSPQMKFGGSLLDMEKPKYKDGGEKDPYRTYHGEDGKKKLQRELLSLGYTELGKADGKLGTKTGRAVRRFQKEQGLSGQEGIAGPETLNRLRQVLASPQAVASARTGRSPQAITSPEVKKTPGEYDPYEDMGNGMMGWQVKMLGTDEERLRDIDYKEKKMTYNMERDLADGPVSSLQYNDEGKVAYLQDQKRIRAKYKDGFDSLNKEKDEIARGEGWKWKAREIKEMNKDLKSYDENFERTQDSIQESRGRERIGLGPVYPPLDPLAFEVPDPFGGQYTPDPNNPLLPGDDFMRRTPNDNAPNYNAAAPAPSGDLYGRNWLERMDNNLSQSLKDPNGFAGKFIGRPIVTGLETAYATKNPWAGLAAGAGSIAEEAIFGTDYIDRTADVASLLRGVMPRTKYIPAPNPAYAQAPKRYSVYGSNVTPPQGVLNGKLPAGRTSQSAVPSISSAQAFPTMPKTQSALARKSLNDQKLVMYNQMTKNLDLSVFAPEGLTYLNKLGIKVAKLPKNKQAAGIKKELSRIKNMESQEASNLRAALQDMLKNLKGNNASLYRFGGKK